MSDLQFYGKCFKCKRNRFFVNKRKINIPVAGIVTSRERFCGKCYKILKTLEVKP